MYRRKNVLLLLVVVGLGMSPNVLTAEVITQPGDPLYAIYNTIVGGNSSPATAEQTGSAYGLVPANAIDQNVATKYLNFGNGPEGESSTTKGVGTGFYVTPYLGATVLTGFAICTAEDVPDRDPVSLTIEGSNATGSGLTLGSNWTLLYSGISGVENITARMTWGNLIPVSTTMGYTSYRLVVTGQRGNANCMQYAEVALMGYAVPEPSTAVLLSMGILGLLAYAWRKQK